MKEMKFICPFCGQHIQCDWRHAGENIPCPGCAKLIRVPLEGDLPDAESPSPLPSPSPVAGDNPFAEVEKVSYVSAKPAAGTELPKTPAVPTGPKQEPATPARAAHTSELHCVCPVCQSALRISMEPEPLPGNAPPPVAKPPPAGIDLSPLNDRERQIAAGRERLLQSAEKPHLDRILGNQPANPSAPSEQK
jgi:hypothetical protein